MHLDDFIQNLARSAGRIVKRKTKSPKTWRAKSSRGDIVTEVDEEVEQYIIRRIRRACPGDRILTEESGAVGSWHADDRPIWVVDPLDGTRNYVMGVPFFCVSIALTRNGVSELGAIYDPVHDEMFFARKGGGAHLNGTPIQVSQEESLEDSVISVSWVKRRADRTKFVDYIDGLSRDTSYFRRFGSAALVMAYVACGRVHGYIQGGLNPWDAAAGAVMIEESAGLVTDFGGDPVDLRNENIEVVAANPKLHSILLNQVVRG